MRRALKQVMSASQGREFEGPDVSDPGARCGTGSAPVVSWDLFSTICPGHYVAAWGQLTPRSLQGVGKLPRFRAAGPQLVWGGQDLTRGLDAGALPSRPRAGCSGAESGMQAGGRGHLLAGWEWAGVLGTFLGLQLRRLLGGLQGAEGM